MFTRRFLAACALAHLASAAPLEAWEFSASPICTVTHSAPPLELKMTYDGALYTLRLSHDAGWPSAPVFSMRFAPMGPFISTTQHQVLGNSLLVADSGFGNVLNGLQDNLVAAAILGTTVRRIDLKEAAPAIEAFRNCKPAPATS